MPPMPGIHVRGLSEETMRAPKHRARAHHRSVQGEVREILVEAARAAPPEGGCAPIRLRHVDVGGDRPWKREDIYYGDEGR